jgi:hypothetical protein
VHEVGARQVDGRARAADRAAPSTRAGRGRRPRIDAGSSTGSSAAGRRAPPRRRPAAGTPSSNGEYCGSSTSGVRACSCRNRSRIRSVHPAWAPAAPRCGCAWARAVDDGVSTPNCQRSRFFCADAR